MADRVNPRVALTQRLVIAQIWHAKKRSLAIDLNGLRRDRMRAHFGVPALSLFDDSEPAVSTELTSLRFSEPGPAAYNAAASL